MAENESKHSNSKIVLIIMAIVAVILATAITFYFINNRGGFMSNNKAHTNAPPSMGRDGVFIAFSATAQGKVTNVTDTSITIQSDNISKQFTISDNVFVTNNSSNNLLDKIAEKLIPTAFAQTKISTPSATSNTSFTGPPPPPSSNSGQTMKIKSVKDVKVGQNVTLTLTKQKESDPWIVTTIFIQQ